MNANSPRPNGPDEPGATRPDAVAPRSGEAPDQAVPNTRVAAPQARLEALASAAGDGLNGSFLDCYDTQRAEPVSVGAITWYRRYGMRRKESETLPGVAYQVAKPEATRRQHELIFDESNLLPFHFLRTGDRIGRAVVKILRADGACGTGFLVAPDILLTNHHVLPDPEIAANARVLANYEACPRDDAAGRPSIVRLVPKDLFATNAELDFTFCGVDRLGHLGAVPLERSSASILPSEVVNIVQHPRGRPKEVALQDNRVVKVDNVIVQYHCDTEPGSSGSPVFNNQWDLVAIHHASIPTDHHLGRSAAGLDGGARYLNEGIRISAIALWLETATAQESIPPDQLQRLRDLICGFDPQIGFFGALGRRPDGQTAPEVVVECYHRDADDLDIAFWNLGHLKDNALQKLPELAMIIAGMRMDIWCLYHPDGEALRSLCEFLDASFQLDYAYQIEPKPHPTLAILHRRSDSLELRWLGTACTCKGLMRLSVTFASRHDTLLSLIITPIPQTDAPPAETGCQMEGFLCEAINRHGTALLLIGDGLAFQQGSKLLEVDPRAVVRSAGGSDGNLTIVADRTAPLGPAFVSPNLGQQMTEGADLTVASGRRWPALLDDLRGSKPIALRLSMEPRVVPAITGPAGSTRRPDPDDTTREAPTGERQGNRRARARKGAKAPSPAATEPRVFIDQALIEQAVREIMARLRNGESSGG